MWFSQQIVAFHQQRIWDLDQPLGFRRGNTHCDSSNPVGTWRAALRTEGFHQQYWGLQTKQGGSTGKNLWPFSRSFDHSDTETEKDWVNLGQRLAQSKLCHLWRNWTISEDLAGSLWSDRGGKYHVILQNSCEDLPSVEVNMWGS